MIMDMHEDMARRCTIKPFTNLTRIVEYKFPDSLNRTFGVTCLPHGMEIVNNEIRCTEKVPTIAVIDLYTSGMGVELGRDLYVNHGIMVTKYAVRGLENEIGILGLDLWKSRDCRDCRDCKDELGTYEGILDAVHELVRIQKCYRNIIALNLSMGFNRLYRNLSEALEEELSVHNVEEKKEKLLAFLSKQTDGYYAIAYQTIQAINQLVDEGVTIYQSTGNARNLVFNLLLLSNVQYNVSAYDYRRAAVVFSNRKGNATHFFRRVYGKDNKLTSVTDGMIEILPHEIRKPAKLTRKKHELILLPRKVSGTSFSTPLQLNEDLKAGRLGPLER